MFKLFKLNVFLSKILLEVISHSDIHHKPLRQPHVLLLPPLQENLLNHRDLQLFEQLNDQTR